MLHEYALDPTCLKDWDIFIYLIEKFGIPYGRLISDFPEDWLKEVDKTCKKFTHVQRQIMAIKLKMIKKQALIKSKRPYNPKIKSWKINAINQHQKNPFHAVVTGNNEEKHQFVLTHEDIFKEAPLWDVPCGATIPRNAEALSTAIRLLLQMSNRILFIDKLFDPATKRWQATLHQFIQLALHNRGERPSFEYHLKYNDREAMQEQEFHDYCEKNLATIIPTGIELKLYRWESKTGGEDFHARYVLTEKGGVGIDWGLDEGKPGETTDVVLLDTKHWEKRWNNFQQESDAFELYDEVSIVGN